jgi:hypothetical protein
MDLAVAWLAFPAVLLGACWGCGLLVSSLSGRALPRALVPACGLAVIVCVGQFLTLGDATAELTAPAVVALALAGVGMAWPLRLSRSLVAPALTALAVFMVFAAPVVLSGEATLAGFIKLDDTATWLTLTDRIMEHGRSLEGLAPSTYEATLAFNLGDGYPVGVFVPLGVGTVLLGTDPASLIQPYMALLAAMLALSLWALAGQVSRSPAWRGVAAFVGAQSALLFGYYLWGGVKELAAALLVATAAALAGRLLSARLPVVRAVAPLTLVSAALVGVLSAGGLAWLAPILIAAVILLARDAGPVAAARRAGAFAVGFAVLCLPVVIPGGLIPPTSSPLTDDSAKGNLITPLEPQQVLGVWPSGDFRVAPDAEFLAYALMALVAALAIAGLMRAARAPRLGAALYVAGSLASCLVLVSIGSPWVDGKALATASPALPFAAALGAGWLAARGLRAAAVAAGGALAAGVLWSNALAYGGVHLAPGDQFEELEEIGELIDGEEPTLMTSYEPFAVRHFLREGDSEGVSELRRRRIPLREGDVVEKGFSADTDLLDPAALGVYRTLVLRRSPAASRPPSPYRLVWQGEFYEVWQRPSGQPTLPGRVGLGDRYDPLAQPDCDEVAALAAGGDLLAASGESPIVIPLSQAEYPPSWSTPDTRFAPVPTGEGSIEATVQVEPESPPLTGSDPMSGGGSDPRTYEIWLGGSLGSGYEVFVDGSPVGDGRHDLSNSGGYVRLGGAQLEPGTHDVEVRLSGPDLHPGSAGSHGAVGPLVLSPSEAADREFVTVPADDYRSLCGREWDWIEVAG